MQKQTIMGKQIGKLREKIKTYLRTLASLKNAPKLNPYDYQNVTCNVPTTDKLVASTSSVQEFHHFLAV